MTTRIPTTPRAIKSMLTCSPVLGRMDFPFLVVALTFLFDEGTLVPAPILDEVVTPPLSELTIVDWFVLVPVLVDDTVVLDDSTLDDGTVLDDDSALDDDSVLDDGVVADSILAFISASTAFNCLKISSARTKVSAVMLPACARAASSDKPAYWASKAAC